MRQPAAALSLIVAVVAFPSSVFAADVGSEYFEAKIRPVLVEHCYECHSAQAKKLGGNLLLDSRDAVRKGGDSGDVIVPGKPDESLLVAAVRYSPDSVHMPPNGKLPATVIADFEQWVKLGAPDRAIRRRRLLRPANRGNRPCRCDAPGGACSPCAGPRCRRCATLPGRRMRSIASCSRHSKRRDWRQQRRGPWHAAAPVVASAHGFAADVRAIGGVLARLEPGARAISVG